MLVVATETPSEPMDATRRRQEIEHTEALKHQLEFLRSKDFVSLVERALKHTSATAFDPLRAIHRNLGEALPEQRPQATLDRDELDRLQSAEVRLALLEALMREHPELTANELLQIHEGEESGPEWWDRTGLILKTTPLQPDRHPNWLSPMSVDTPIGATVEYMAENGRDTDREHIERAGIKKGQRLTVRRLHRESWYSRVEFDEQPGQFFNTVCFCIWTKPTRND